MSLKYPTANSDFGAWERRWWGGRVSFSEAQRTALETPPGGGQPELECVQGPLEHGQGVQDTHVCYSAGSGAGTTPHPPVVSSPGGRWQ